MILRGDMFDPHSRAGDHLPGQPVLRRRPVSGHGAGIQVWLVSHRFLWRRRQVRQDTHVRGQAVLQR